VAEINKRTSYNEGTSYRERFQKTNNLPSNRNDTRFLVGLAPTLRPAKSIDFLREQASHQRGDRAQANHLDSFNGTAGKFVYSVDQVRPRPPFTKEDVQEILNPDPDRMPVDDTGEIDDKWEMGPLIRKSPSVDALREQVSDQETAFKRLTSRSETLGQTGGRRYETLRTRPPIVEIPQSRLQHIGIDALKRGMTVELQLRKDPRSSANEFKRITSTSDSFGLAGRTGPQEDGPQTGSLRSDQINSLIRGYNIDFIMQDDSFSQIQKAHLRREGSLAYGDANTQNLQNFFVRANKMRLRDGLPTEIIIYYERLTRSAKVVCEALGLSLSPDLASPWRYPKDTQSSKHPQRAYEDMHHLLVEETPPAFPEQVKVHLKNEAAKLMAVEKPPVEKRNVQVQTGISEQS